MARPKGFGFVFNPRCQPIAVDRDQPAARRLDRHQSSFAMTCLIWV
jgi:hypothetical protein